MIQKEKQAQQGKSLSQPIQRNTPRELLFLRMLALFLMAFFFNVPHIGISLPRWYLFFTEKLCIAVPLLFFIGGFWSQEIFLEKGKNRDHSLSERVGKVIFISAILYFAIAVLGYYYAHNILVDTPFIVGKSRSLLTTILYPSQHLIGFLWLIPSVLVTSLIAFLWKKEFEKRGLKKETYNISLGILLLVAIGVRIFALYNSFGKEINLFAMSSILEYFCYGVWGMVLYQYHTKLSKRSVKLIILLLFHVVLFTRIFAPYPAFIRPLLDTLYNLLLLGLYALLAQRGASLMKRKIGYTLAHYAEAIMVASWFISISLAPLYLKTAMNSWNISLVLLIIVALSLFIPTLLILQWRGMTEKISRNKSFLLFLSFIFVFGLSTSCQKDKKEPSPIGFTPHTIKYDFVIDPFEEIELCSKEKGISYQWFCAEIKNESENIEEGQYRFISDEEKPFIWLQKEGYYKVIVKITQRDKEVKESFVLHVRDRDFKHSPYITKVYDYLPAPGQFIHIAPAIKEGWSKEQILDTVLKSLGGDTREVVSLGAFGGSITFGFDHLIANLEGNDITLLGNAFDNASEAGIVEVSYDRNHNGIPDDPWYELRGSESLSTETISNYEITYFKPSENHTPIVDPEEESTTDAHYILWRDNQGGEGYIPKNKFHPQSYYPLWIKEKSYTLQGKRLKNNASLTLKGKTKYWQLKSFDWGYVDNKPNNTPEGSLFDISKAQNSQGEEVNLVGIHFVRVYTALNQVAGWLGETSTEILGAFDIHYKNKIHSKEKK